MYTSSRNKQRILNNQVTFSYKHKNIFLKKMVLLSQILHNVFILKLSVQVAKGDIYLTILLYMLSFLLRDQILQK